MNQITQHVPAFVETRDARQRAEFTTLDELLAVPFVARWADDPHFFRFSSDDKYLMAEQYEGRSWWVVGFLSEPCPELPIWRPIYRLCDQDGNVEDYEGRDVVSSRGDDVRLLDGRTLKWVRETNG